MHAVVIHDGSAESGHYYSYIRDLASDKWRCFNDHRVTEVSLEQVLVESAGGSTKSAIWVSYMSAKEAL